MSRDPLDTLVEYFVARGQRPNRIALVSSSSCVDPARGAERASRKSVKSVPAGASFCAAPGVALTVQDLRAEKFPGAVVLRAAVQALPAPLTLALTPEWALELARILPPLAKGARADLKKLTHKTPCSPPLAAE